MFSREAMMGAIGFVLIVWGAVSSIGRDEIPDEGARSPAPAPPVPATTELACQQPIAFTSPPDGSHVRDDIQRFRVTPTTSRIDDFFPSITFYDDINEIPLRLCSFTGEPERCPPALRFTVGGYPSLRETFDQVERISPVLAGRGADFVVDGLKKVVRSRGFWISMLGAMPGRTTVLIDRAQIVLPAAMAMDVPEHIRTTFHRLDDGSFLIAEGPL